MENFRVFSLLIMRWVVGGMLLTGTIAHGANLRDLLEPARHLLNPQKARGYFDELMRKGKANLPEVKTLLGTRNLRLLRAALDLADKWDGPPNQIREELLRLLNTPQLGGLRLRALKLLARIDSHGDIPLSALLRAFSDRNLRLRQALAETLVDLLAKNPAVPALKNILAEKSGQGRRILVMVLTEYGARLHPIVPIVAGVFTGKKVRTAEIATAVLPQLVPGIGTAMPLVQMLLVRSSDQAPVALADAPAIDFEHAEAEESLATEADAADEAASFEDVPAREF